MSIAKHVEAALERYSWVRRMFEEGAHLKAVHGADRVFDFSLGNLDVEPPESFHRALRDIASSKMPGVHRYMPNAGYEETRAAVAEYVSREQGIRLDSQQVVMTCGAGGALNCAFRTLLDPGDEVVVSVPYFVEYGFYVENHGGVVRLAPSGEDFTLDIDAIAAAITPRTKAILINSPNNPTGQIYDESSLADLVALARAQCKRLGHVLYIVSDEPYRRFVYDGAKVPSLLARYENSIVAGSYSKELAIAGERIGFLVTHPDADHAGPLMDGLILANRVLGYINAPALMQRVVRHIQGECVDVSVFQSRRDRMCQGLAETGYEFVRPRGAFYVFPKSPIADDVAFVRMLQQELILVLPGSGFGAPGHLRISYCVDEGTIERSLPGFAEARRQALAGDCLGE